MLTLKKVLDKRFGTYRPFDVFKDAIKCVARNMHDHCRNKTVLKNMASKFEALFLQS